jgi:Domain of unknown function (DUF4129)
MSLSLSCACGAKFEVAETFAGQSVACPECQQPVRVPAATGARLQTSGYALASVVLALVGMFTIVLPALAVLLGLCGLVSIARHRGRIAGTSYAVFGIVLGLVFVPLMLFAVSREEIFDQFREKINTGKADFSGPLEIVRAQEGYAITRPCLAALLLPLSGLGSGACQEVFHSRAEGKTAGLIACLTAALRQGWNHAAARGCIFLAFFLGSWLIVMPGLAVLVSAAAVHPILAAGEISFFRALRTASQESQRQPGKTAAVVLCRIPLLFFAVINLFLTIRVGFWTVDHLGGFDLARIELFFSLSNPVYLTALLMLSWMLLAPYAEAANYLLHVDARARYEGLDLWYRVQRYFPVRETVTAVLALLATAGFALVPASATASDSRAASVAESRRAVQAIRSEIEKADPFPGSQRWADRLRGVVARLDGGADAARSRYRWLHRELEGFEHRGREGALQVLADVDRRLAILEQNLDGQPAAGSAAKRALSNEELGKLLPPEESDEEEQKPLKPRETGRPREAEVKRPVVREGPEEGEPDPGLRRGEGRIAAHAEGGFGGAGWPILGGLLLAVLILALVLSWQRRDAPKPNTPPQESGQEAPSLETILTRPDQYSVTGLWREADELARAGRLREAVRTLYLAVLALLHRSNLIRFERTRTNGEYVQQLRARENLQAPFRQMTNVFEVKCYSESDCQAPDYETCRELAEDIKEGVRSP